MTGARLNTLARLRGRIERIEAGADTHALHKVALGHAEAHVPQFAAGNLLRGLALLAILAAAIGALHRADGAAWENQLLGFKSDFRDGFC